MPRRDGARISVRRVVPRGGSAAWLVAAAVVVLAATARWQGAPASAVALEPTGHTGGAVRAVAVVGDEAWVGEGSGIRFLDLSRRDAIEPGVHEVLDPYGEVWSLARAGRWLYVGGTAGLRAVDVANPQAPRAGTLLHTGGAVRAITAVPAPSGGARLFVVQPDTDVSIVEAGPDGRLSARFTIAGTAGALAPVAVDGDVALVAGGTGVRILDISDPDAPVVTFTIATVGQVRGVAVRDGTAWIADTTAGLLAVSLDRPGEVASTLPGVTAGRLYLAGAHLFVIEQHAVGPATVRIVDISEPLRPQDPLGGESNYSVLRGAADLVVQGSRVVAARGWITTVADVASALWPTVLAEHESTWPIAQLADAGACVYVARGPNGLDVVDVRDASEARVVLGWRPPGGTHGVHVAGDYAYLSTIGGLARFDVRDPCDPIPREMAFAADWGPTRWLAATKMRLVSVTQTDLLVVELRGDGTPEERTRAKLAELEGWPPGAFAQGVALYDLGAAYVAAGQAGLVVINVIDAMRPLVRRVERAPDGLAVTSVLVRDQILYAGTSGGIALYDLLDPFTPRLVGSSLGHDGLLDIALDGGRLYGAADLAGLLAFDVDEPERPTLVGTFKPRYPIGGVAAGSGRVEAAGAGVVVLVPRAGPAVPTWTPPPATRAPAVPSATPYPSATASASPTATATATVGVTPTATATAPTEPRPGTRRVLPLAVR